MRKQVKKPHHDPDPNDPRGRRRVQTAGELIDDIPMWIEGVEDSKGASRYTKEDKIRACVAYCVLGTFARTAEYLDLNANTVREWGKKEWWVNCMDQVRSEHEHVYRAGMGDVLREGFSQLADRMREGDPRLVTRWTKNADGTSEQVVETVFVPLRSRDLGAIIAMMYDKLRLSLNLPTQIRKTDTDNLGDLADKFRQMTGTVERLQGQVDAKVVSKD